MDEFDYRVIWGRYVARFTTGKTQAQVGQMAGVDQSTAGRWLRGISEPNHAAVIRFARAIDRNPLEALVAAGLLSLQEAGRGITRREIDFLVDLQDDGPEVVLVFPSNPSATIDEPLAALDDESIAGEQELRNEP